MNKLGRDRRGQFIVLAAVILAAFIFSMVLSISRLSTSRLEVAYEPVDEIVLAIARDFERAMTRALATATQNYNRTKSISSAIEAGEGFIQNWLKVILESYSGFGINITLTPENSMGRNINWIVNWGEWEGISGVHTTFGIDIKAYGLDNLALTSLKAVYLNILNAKIELTDTGSTMTVVFMVQMGGRGRATPISDLTQNNVALVAKDITSRLIRLEYMGRGIYRAQFDSTDLVVERFTLVIMTNDKIIVAADLPTCILSLESRDLATGEVNKGGLFMINGTRQCAPQYIFPLFQNQVVIISFSPPENANFIGFSAKGPLSLTADESIVMVGVHGSGYGSVIALYSTSAISAPEYCYLTLKSVEYPEGINDLGRIKLNEAIYSELPKTVQVPFGESMLIIYYPESGYVFKCWNFTGNIQVMNPSLPSTYVTAFGDGEIIAVYEKSRPEDWRVIYISPKKEKSDDFVLTPNEPGKGREIRPISYGQDSRRGDSTDTTPVLFLGENVVIVLFARASSRDVIVRVALGFYSPEGNYNEIISGVITVTKSNTHLNYTISGPPNTRIIPEGSRLTLIFERTTMDPGGGTLHILCGPETPAEEKKKPIIGVSKIILW